MLSFRDELRAEFYENQLKSHIKLLQAPTAVLFAHLLNRDVCLKVLGACITYVSQPEQFSKSNYHYIIGIEWVCRLILASIGESSYINGINILLDTLSHIKPSYASLLRQEILNTKDQTSRINDLIDAIKYLKSENPPLFECLRPYLEFSLSTINPKVLVDSFGIELFTIRTFIDDETLGFFSDVKIDSGNLPEVLMNLAPSTQSDAVSSLQSLLAMREPFPERSALFKRSSLLTLVNQSIIQKKHFLSVFAYPAMWLLRHSNFDGFNKYCEHFEKMKPYLFLSTVPDLIGDTQKFTSYLEYFRGVEMSNQLSDFFERLRNDMTLLSYLNETSNYRIMWNDLINTSVCIILMPIMTTVNFTIISSYVNKKYSLLKDQDRDTDFGIILSFLAVATALRLAVRDSMKFFMDKGSIKDILLCIKNKLIRETTADDIYSLIFLKDSQGFVFNVESATFLIEEIMPFASDRALTSATASYLTRARLFNEIELEKCVMSVSHTLADLLYAGEYAAAIPLIGSDESLIEIIDAATSSESLFYKIEETLLSPVPVNPPEESDYLLKRVTYDRFTFNRDKEEFENTLAKIRMGGQMETSYVSIDAFVNSSLVCPNGPDELPRLAERGKLDPLVFEAYLYYYSKSGLSKESMSLLESEYPAVAAILTIQEGSLQDAARYLGINSKGNTIHFDLSERNLLTLFAQIPFPHSEFNDLYFHQPDVITEFFMRHINSLKVSDCLKLDCFATYRSLEGLHHNNVYTLEPSKVVSRLRITGDEETLYLYLREFNLKVDLSEPCDKTVPTDAFELLSFVRSLSSDMTRTLYEDIEKAIHSILNSMEVASSDDEIDTLNNLRKLTKICQELMQYSLHIQNTYLKIKTLSLFINQRPHLRFGVCYSLKEESVKELVAICLKFDLQTIALQFCEHWHLPDEPLLINIASKCFNLKLFDEGTDIVESIHSLQNIPESFIDRLVNSLALPCTTDIDVLKTQAVVINTSMSHKVVKPQIPMFFTDLCVRSATQTPLLADSPQVISLDRCLNHLGEERRLLSFYASNGSLDPCLDAIKTLKAKNYIKYVLYPTLAAGFWNMLWRSISRRPDLISHTSLVLDRFRRSGFIISLADALFRLGKQDDAINTLVSATRTTHSWDEVITICKQIEDKCDVTGRTPMNGKMTIGEIDAIRQKARYQIMLASFCEQHSIGFDVKLTLFGSDQMVFLFLLQNCQFQFAIELLQYISVDLSELCGVVVEGLLQKGHQAVIAYLNEMLILNEMEYSILAVFVLHELGKRVGDNEMKAYMNKVPYKNVKAEVYMKLNKLEEAFYWAKQSKNMRLMKMLRDKTKDGVNEALWKKCDTWIRR